MNNQQNKGNWFKAPKSNERLNDHEKTVVQGMLGQVDIGYAKLFDRFSHMASVLPVQVAANASVAEQVSVQPGPETKLANASPSHKYDGQSVITVAAEGNEAALRAARESVNRSYDQAPAGLAEEMANA